MKNTFERCCGTWAKIANVKRDCVVALIEVDYNHVRCRRAIDYAENGWKVTDAQP
jgi:hypothetical protein